MMCDAFAPLWTPTMTTTLRSTIVDRLQRSDNTVMHRRRRRRFKCRMTTVVLVMKRIVGSRGVAEGGSFSAACQLLPQEGSSVAAETSTSATIVSMHMLRQIGAQQWPPHATHLRRPGAPPLLQRGDAMTTLTTITIALLGVERTKASTATAM
jgi:hypothetical protein